MLNDKGENPYLGQAVISARDLTLINNAADRLNAEAQEALQYQALELASQELPRG